MTVTSGFFNSKNGDRKYDALQVGELFDGLINDGVYETIYNQFHVTSYDGKRIIKVDTGRGWFNHTWVKNDTPKLFTIEDSKSTYNRIDAMVIEVNINHTGRRDDVRYIVGTESVNPQRPMLVKGVDGIYQYPLAYITVPGLTSTGQANVTTAHITNMIGTSECPFVTGVVSVMNIDILVEQWNAQWKNMIQKWYDVHDTEWHEWANEHKHDFISWFKSLNVMLDGDVAANLAGDILRLEKVLNTLATDRRLYKLVLDHDYDPVLDNFGDPLDGSVFFAPTGEENVIYVEGSGSCDIEPIPNDVIDSLWTE